MDMFDDDDTLMYEPALTAAIIMTGDDEEAEKAALEVRRHAGSWSASRHCLNHLACQSVIWAFDLQPVIYVHEVQVDVCYTCGQRSRERVHAGLQRSRDH